MFWLLFSVFWTLVSAFECDHRFLDGSISFGRSLDAFDVSIDFVNVHLFLMVLLWLSSILHVLYAFVRSCSLAFHFFYVIKMFHMHILQSYIYIYVCMYVCVYMFTFAYIYIYIYTYICVYIYMCLCVRIMVH